MPNIRENGNQPPWPREVMHPALIGWEKTALKWLWELLPAYHRENWMLVSYPRLLVRQACRQVDSQIYMLRRKPTSYSELQALGVSPKVIERVIRLDAVEVSRLGRVRDEIRMVAKVLEESPLLTGASPSALP